MKKTLIPILALCAGAAGTLIVTGAFAQTATDTNTHTPAMTKPVGPHHDPAEMAARMKAMCADRYARAVGRLAYVEAKLDLTPAQQPLFTRWKSVKLDAANSHRAKCGDHDMHKMARQHGVLDRMTREEDMLKNRLAELQAEQPALEALINSLTPEQKRAFGGDHHHMIGRVMMSMHMMARRGGMTRPGWSDDDTGMTPPPPPAQ